MEQVSKNGIRKLLLLCSCIFLASSSSPGPSAREVAEELCKTTNCIPFEIVEKHKTYEVRRYSDFNLLAMTMTKAKIRHAVKNDMFPKYDINLIEKGGTHHYLPVIFDTTRFSKASLCYIYPTGQHPKPSSNAMTVMDFPGETVYVRTFYARTLRDITKNLRALVKDVGPGKYRTAFTMYGQHNIYEVAIRPTFIANFNRY